jgi:hypothetical protein
MMARCIALDTDCAQICSMVASAMARGSENANTFCKACADVCQDCGDECAKHDMNHCQACARACRACAQECRNMATMA